MLWGGGGVPHDLGMLCVVSLKEMASFSDPALLFSHHFDLSLYLSHDKCCISSVISDSVSWLRNIIIFRDDSL